MITYSRIGAYGRLGNQMFQFASTYGIAKKLGYDVVFPMENANEYVIEHFKDGITREVTFDVPKYFNIPNDLLISKSDIVTEHRYKETNFHYEDSYIHLHDNCDLIGYFQSEKYFEHCVDDIRSVFSYRPEIVKSTIDRFSNYLNIGKSTAIHVRVGDYIGLQQYHPVLTDEYYERAINELLDDTDIFLIFSDNLDYATEMFYSDDRIVYIDQGSDIEQMCLMSMCDNNIIANSTYSWWAAWLNANENKKVIAPKKWFGPMYENVNDTKDLYCQKWIIL